MILSTENQRKLVKKRKAFDEISAKLKQEFFGLDKTIDEIMNSIQSWYLFAEYQTRPLVVNLWGMTGTGKTSIVKRLSQLLDMENYYIHTDMGEQIDAYSWNARNKFEEAITFKDKQKCIICLDEFQLSRTVKGTDEIDRTKIRLFWELLDTGIISTKDLLSNNYDELQALYNILKQCLQNNIEVKNGKIIKGKQNYISIMKHAETYHALWNLELDFDEPGDELHFLPISYRKELFELFTDLFDNSLEFERYLLSLDGKGTMNLLNDAITRSQNNKEVDLRKALIFVIGNLDEVFQMAGEDNPDIDPDIFYKYTLKINSTQIKQGLAKRFRIEQIARLGNNHIIYPALSSTAYRTLIDFELQKISARFIKQTFAELIFDKSVNELIFKEGVFPYQGARPVLTSIVRLIDANIGNVIAVALEKYPETDKFIWSFNNGEHQIDFVLKDNILYRLKIKANLMLDSYRMPKNNDKQALIAVHESGHAIATALSSRILPSKIISVSPLDNLGGSCQVDWPDEIISKRNIRHRIISMLGGYIAEKLIFGEDNLSRGSGSDLAQASFVANDAIKRNGMGATLKFIDSNEFIPVLSSQLTKEMENDASILIESCKVEAEQILRRNIKLLTEMAKYLTTHSNMKKEQIRKFIVDYSNEEWVKKEGFIEPDKYYTYRDMLFNYSNGK